MAKYLGKYTLDYRKSTGFTDDDREEKYYYFWIQLHKFILSWNVTKHSFNIDWNWISD